MQIRKKKDLIENDKLRIFQLAENKKEATNTVRACLVHEKTSHNGKKKKDSFS